MSISDQGFLNLVISKAKITLESDVTYIYQTLVNQFGNQIGFGIEGSREFVNALILREYDEATKQYIDFAIAQVFQEK